MTVKGIRLLEQLEGFFYGTGGVRGVWSVLTDFSLGFYNSIPMIFASEEI